MVLCYDFGTELSTFCTCDKIVCWKIFCSWQCLTLSSHRIMWACSWICFGCGLPSPIILSILKFAPSNLESRQAIMVLHMYFCEWVHENWQQMWLQKAWSRKWLQELKTDICVCASVHVSTCVSVRVCVFVRVYVFVQVCVFVRVSVCMWVRVCPCVCVPARVRACSYNCLGACGKSLLLSVPASSWKAPHPPDPPSRSVVC